jgi:hypothetical protein
MGRVLIFGETSGIMRRAFAARGHDAWSVDLKPAEDGSNRHFIGDGRKYFHLDWDMLMVAHPPCTRLCNSGVRWLIEPPKGKTLEAMWADLDVACALFSDCWNAPIERIAVENPIMHRHAKERIANYSESAAQTVQPWWFGDPAFKATRFWLRGLPKLHASDKLSPPAKGTAEHKAWSFIHMASPGKDRSRLRSRSFPGMAAAVADQWGGLLPPAQGELFG